MNKFLIVGLGNIGDEYANTRHNIGFIVLDAVAQDAGVTFTTDRYAAVTRFRLKGRTFILIKPSTYMNLSGKAVKYWMVKEEIEAEDMLVISDDVDLELGAFRIKPKGSGGSHNGLNSIIEQLGTSDFPRFRIGIGNDYARGFQVDYVLGRWTRHEEAALIPRIRLAAEAVKSFGLAGINLTMTSYNNK
ncbi:MAG: aminoacyl-tRNA hydrolase [Bacteroidetes bacterium]|nr:aminoacyl-tRNA hydrolase [Bacteroidota bacterium]